MATGAQAVSTGIVDHIPVAWVEPQRTAEAALLALSLPALGIDKSFRATLRAAHRTAGARVRVIVHPGFGHLDGPQSRELRRRCLEWFEQHDGEG